MLELLLIVVLSHPLGGDKAGPGTLESEAPVRGRKTKACSNAEDVLKSEEQELRKCESEYSYRDIGPSCLEESLRKQDAECRMELACTPSTRDPEECRTAPPRG